jgi:erythromycin esterase
LTRPKTAFVVFVASYALCLAGERPARSQDSTASIRPPAITAAERDARIAFLKKHAVPVSSIDPGTVDFAELEPLRAAIGDCRIVMLGEATHGDGPVFSAKIRLIKFLHQRMGFDVLAFESGFYDMRRAGADVRSGKDPEQALATALFVDWSASTQTRPLWRYLAEQRNAGRPLELAGFDMQFTGSASTDHLLKDLDEFLSRAGLPPEAETAASRVKAALALVFEDPGFIAKGSEFQKVKPEDQAEALTAHNALAEALASLSLPGEPERLERDYWVQLLKSSASFLEMNWRIDPLAMDDKTRDWAINLRDRQMGDNFVWLAKQAYPDRKIIVWAATGHIIRQRYSHTNAYGPAVPMGDWIDKVLGPEVYSVGFTAYEGWWGTVEMPMPAEAPPAVRNSLEELLFSAGFAYAFLDLRNSGPGGPWLRGPLLCRALRYMPVLTDWSRLLDGIFFLRKTSPSVRSDFYRLRDE